MSIKWPNIHYPGCAFHQKGIYNITMENFLNTDTLTQVLIPTINLIYLNDFDDCISTKLRF